MSAQSGSRPEENLISTSSVPPQSSWFAQHRRGRTEVFSGGKCMTATFASDARRSRSRTSRSRTPGRRTPNQNPAPITEDDVLVPVSGILDVRDNNGFVRTEGYLPSPDDVYVSS